MTRHSAYQACKTLYPDDKLVCQILLRNFFSKSLYGLELVNLIMSFVGS